MKDESKSRDVAYNDTRDMEPHRETGNINDRTNNVGNDTPAITNDETIERANDTGIGDSGDNDEKLTKYTSNRSADA